MSWIPRIGDEFAQYRLEALLGHGGMSIVYRAEHVTLGRKVALKLLSPQLSEDESFRERFTKESRLAASLDHPNIIPIYEASESDGVFYIAMRYVEGSDLRSLLKEGPIDPKRLVPIIEQTANALTAAHGRGLVHRDVKPANILIDQGSGRGDADHAYLSDFGVAKQIAAPGLTQTGMFVGTVDYASPEQIEGLELDGRADVYSLGCVVYECLTGSAAYDKDSEVAMMYAHLLEPAPSVTSKRPDLPPEVDEVVSTAMAKSRDDRYDTPKQFAQALARAFGTTTTAAAAAPAAATAPETPATVLASGLQGAAASGEATAVHAPAAAAATQVASQAPPARAPEDPAGPPPGGTPAAPTQAGARPGRSKLLLVAIVGGLVAIAAVAAIVAVVMGGGDDEQASATTNGGTTSGQTTAAAQGSLLEVLVPSEIAATCASKAVPTQGAVETSICNAPDTAPIADPDLVELSFFKDADALAAAAEAVESGLEPTRCGERGSADETWIHAATGKTGGKRACFTDGRGQFVVVWTHVKLDSEDHVDMLGVAREPGRSPTIVRWWSSVNDAIGKCRAQIAAPTCLATIKAITGTS